MIILVSSRRSVYARIARNREKEARVIEQVVRCHADRTLFTFDRANRIEACLLVSRLHAHRERVKRAYSHLTPSHYPPCVEEYE